MGSDAIPIRFDRGTLLVDPKEHSPTLPSAFAFDERIKAFRAPASAYAELLRSLRKDNIPYDDQARKYKELDLSSVIVRPARPYQTEAVAAWLEHERRGVVVLPTGAGKTHVAILAIERCQRSTLVVAPTLELVRQWVELLHATFQVPIGIVGGGEHTIEDLTVTTYDSAYLHLDRMGSRFGLVVFDECHHLPSESYSLIAEFSLAPFRLGLSATPERSDRGEDRLGSLVGPFVYRKEIVELSGEFLSEYRTERILVRLSPDEETAYREAREVYISFLKTQHIAMGSPDGFSQFLMLASRSEEGRRALAAYRRQREIAFATQTKFAEVARLLSEHAQDRVILFTQDNETAYRLSTEFLVPVITHRTPVRERSELLKSFRDGSLPVLATSKVLNEGIDVPEASVAIVLSGSGSVREHVQRLGRILRKREGKQAILYEIVSAGTSEASTSERRREHSAYRRSR